jgi:glycosyltransferase involved in cell wall biosynthesis
MLTKKRRILVISQYFYPEEFRINDICREWTNRGYKVTVITGIPNYPQGKFYKGYGLFSRRRDQMSEVCILRLPILPRGKSKVMLALNYLSFAISGFFWSHLTPSQADVVFIFELSPMTQALPGVWFAKRRRIPCYIYVQDLWPESVEIITGIRNAFLLNCLGRMVDRIYRGCTKIFTTSQSFIAAIAARGVPESKLIFWPQYSEVSTSSPITEGTPEIPDDGLLKIVFAGNIGFAQGLEILPEAALILQQRRTSVRFVIIGDGRYKSTLISIIQDAHLEEYFSLIERQPASRIPQMLSQCDVAFLSLAPSKIFDKTIPAKLQTYLASGMPIIAAADGETKSIIDAAQAGFCGPAGDAAKLVDHIIEFISLPQAERIQMAENALRYSLIHFDKKTLLDKMDQYLWSALEKEIQVNV